MSNLPPERIFGTHLFAAAASLDIVKIQIDRGKVLTLDDVAKLSVLSQQVKTLRNSLILKLSLEGWEQTTIATMFELSPARISQIVSEASKSKEV